MMRQIVQAIVPDSLRRQIRKRINLRVRRFKSPRMVWGHKDVTGDWRPNTRVGDTVYFNHPDTIQIADNVFIGHFSMLDGTGNLTIEEGVQLAGWNGIYTHSSHIAIRLYGKHYQEVPEGEKRGFITDSVRISRYAFIGAGAIILPGVTIGQGALVAAGSIVKNDVGDFQIVSGNPAIPIGTTIDIDAEYLKDAVLKSWYEEWQKS